MRRLGLALLLLAALTWATGSAASAPAPAWSTPSSVDPGNALTAVSCPSASFCVAVDDGGGALTWNGRTWSTPSAIAGSGTLVADVSCASSSFCVAVAGGAALRWNGSTWSTPATLTSGDLDGVSCASASFCAAVGNSGDAYTWNGSAWSAATTIDSTHSIAAVSCATPTFCVAVAGKEELSWNGSAWSAPLLIDTAVSGGGVTAVSCASASFCVAIDPSGADVIWNGTSWGTTTGLGASTLHAVSCASPSFCVAVGASDELTWNGSGWTAPVAIAANSLFGVSCASSTLCAAVDNDGSALIYALPTPPAAPTPVLATSVGGAPVSGLVLVEKPGAHSFTALHGAALLPVGTIVNATAGQVALSTATPHGGATQTGRFHGGQFTVTQARTGLTSLTLSGGTPCASTAAARRRPVAHRDELWGSGHGGFRTSGQYAAATVLGTQWLTQDTCTSTVIRVLEGEVRVTDDLRHRTLIVHAPHSYTAKPR